MAVALPNMSVIKKVMDFIKVFAEEVLQSVNLINHLLYVEVFTCEAD